MRFFMVENDNQYTENGVELEREGEDNQAVISQLQKFCVPANKLR